MLGCSRSADMPTARGFGRAMLCYPKGGTLLVPVQSGRDRFLTVTKLSQAVPHSLSHRIRCRTRAVLQGLNWFVYFSFNTRQICGAESCVLKESVHAPQD